MCNFNDLISACNAKWGGIQGLMVSEFGYVIAQQGDDAKMVCPNHTSEANNHGGNCHASNSKGVWQCFSCGEGGGYLDLVMINKNMTKAEAIRWLAEETGFSLGVSQERSPKDVRQAFVRLCHQNLMDGIAKKDARYLLAETYLRNRGMSAKTIKKFSVGFCVRHGNEISQMKKLGYTGEEMEKAHILRTSKKGQTTSTDETSLLTAISSITIRAASINCSERMLRDSSTGRLFSSWKPYLMRWQYNSSLICFKRTGQSYQLMVRAVLETKNLSRIW